MINAHEIIQVRALVKGLAEHKTFAGLYSGESLVSLLKGISGGQDAVVTLLQRSENDALQNFILDEASRLSLANAVNTSNPMHARHIFSALTNSRKEAFVNPAPLDHFDRVFPAQAAMSPTSISDDIRNFHTKAATRSHVIGSISEKLASLLRYHLSHVSLHDSNISYPEQAISAARIAAVLLDYAHDKGISDQTVLKNSIESDSPFLLLGADVSGIQQYIYSIIPRRAAKNLKGRSFYVQLLIEHIKSAILDETACNDLQTLYASGGGFYMLLPNTNGVRQILESLVLRLESGLYDEFGETLYVALAWEVCAADSLHGEKLSEKWRDLGALLSKRKQHKYATLLDSKFEEFFIKGLEEGKENARDAITGEEIRGRKFQLDTHEVSESTYRLAELGKMLKNTDVWLAFDQEQPHLKAVFRPAGTGPYSYFMSMEDYNRQKPGFTAQPMVYRLNQLGEPGEWNTYLYGGNDYPETRLGVPKSFEELAENKDDKGLEKLGVMRMDVDSLGALFRAGFPTDTLSLPAYTQLSRQLDVFFRGYLNQLWSESNKPRQDKVGYADFTQIIYSGGDDLFIVGKWDILIAMAEEIRTAFGRFTANPNVGISGGLVIVNPKFPLLRAADLAADAEKDAKAHVTRNTEKDAFSLLGYPLHWQTEFAFVKKQKELLVGLIQDKYLPAGFVNRVAGLHAAAAIKNHQITQVQSIWRLAYFIKRQIGKDTPETVKDFLDTWKTAVATGSLPQLPDTHYHPLELLLVIARWAELESRKQ
jgi:CRISPR-associated protein Csm1